MLTGRDDCTSHLYDIMKYTQPTEHRDTVVTVPRANIGFRPIAIPYSLLSEH